MVDKTDKYDQDVLEFIGAISHRVEPVEDYVIIAGEKWDEGYVLEKIIEEDQKGHLDKLGE